MHHQLYRRLRGDIIRPMVYKLLSGVYDSNIVCQLNQTVSSPEVTIFDYLKGTFIMICVNITMEIVLKPIGIVYLIMLLMLTQLVYLRIVFIVFGVIKHVF